MQSDSRIFDRSSTPIPLPPPPKKKFSGAKLFRANDIIFIEHVLNLVPRLSLLCLRNKVVMCVVSSRSPVFTFALRTGVLSCRF